MKKIITALLFFCLFSIASKSTEFEFNPKKLEEYLMDIIPSLPDKEIKAKDGTLLNEAWLEEINKLPSEHRTAMLCCLDWLGFTFATAVHYKDNKLLGDELEKKTLYHIHLKLNNKSLKYVSAYAIMSMQKAAPLWKIYIEKRLPSLYD